MKKVILSATRIHLSTAQWFTLFLLLGILVGCGGTPALQEELSASENQLMQAVVYRNLKRVKSLIAEGVNVNARTSKDSSALFKAASYGYIEIIKELIAAGADVNAQEYEGFTPLISAARTGNSEVVKLLLSAGANVNLKGQKGYSPLHAAATFGSARIAGLLLAAGANVNIRGPRGDTPLHNSSFHGHVEVTNFLIASGADVNAKADKGFTPLQVAAERNHLQIVKALIHAKADVNAKNDDGFAALHFASTNDHVVIADILIKAGANINIQSNAGASPLHTASYRGNVRIVKFLLEKGADVNIRNSLNDTPLHAAAEKGQLQVAKELIGAGALIGAEGFLDRTALQIAESKGHAEFAQFIREEMKIPFYKEQKKYPKARKKNLGKQKRQPAAETKKKLNKRLLAAVRDGDTQEVQSLIEAGADVNAAQPNGMTALFLATGRNYIKIAGMLIAAGANANAVNEETGASILWAATASNHTKIVKMLIAAGADVNAKSKSGITPLHSACLNGHFEMVKILIGAKADLDAKTADEKLTALHIASAQGHTKIAKALIHAGANLLSKNKDGATPLHLAVAAGHIEIARAIFEELKTTLRRGSKKDAEDEDENKDPSLIAGGTGIVVSEAGHVLTNHHVVDACSKVRTRIRGAKIELKVISTDSQNDLALLKLPKPHSSVAVFRGGRAIRPGDSAVVVGFPLQKILAKELNVTTGSVSALAGMENDFRFLQISAPVQPGNSGGPLLDSSGNVVGIVTSKLSAIFIAMMTGEIPQNVNFALKSSVARIFLDANNVSYKTRPSKNKLEPADIGEKARGFTLRLECWK